MATYRILKRSDGDYSVQARLVVGGVLFHQEARTGLKRPELFDAVVELANSVQAARKSLAPVQADTGRRGVTG